MKIFLVRHGESEFNLSNWYMPKKDSTIELNDRGIKQANDAGDALRKILESEEYKNRNIKVLVSPYVRAKRTFEEMNRHLDIEPSRVFEEDLIVEQSYGLFHGFKELKYNMDKYPNEYLRYIDIVEKTGEYYTPKYGGESDFDVVVRAKTLIEAIHREARDENIDILIIISHAAFLKCFVKSFFRHTMEWYENEPLPGNCSIQLIDNNKYIGYVFGDKESKV